MSELEQKVKKSIERLKAFEPPEGYYLAFSGGKDSVVCKSLLDMSGCKYDSTYHVTSVDPPELVRFIKNIHPDVKREVPYYPDDYKNKKLAGKPTTMWNLIPEKLMPPTRLVRYCCDKLKESGGEGRMTVTGVRWAESVNRRDSHGAVTVVSKNANELIGNENFLKTKKGGFISNNDNDDTRQMVERCYKHHRTTVNPIIDWQDRDVWEFIKSENISYCELYDEGFHRLGCVGCPMAGTKQREKEFFRWPKYKESYLRAFDKMLEERKRREKLGGSWRIGTTPRDIFNWWMEYDILPGQMNWFEDFEEGNENWPD